MEIAVNILTGIVIAVVTSVISVQLSLRRFRAERLWDKKHDAYARLIDALYDIANYPSEEIKSSMRDVEIPTEKKDRILERYRDGRQEVYRAIALSVFLIGREAQQRLREYVKEARQAEESTDWIDHLERDLSSSASCLDDIILIARKELGLSDDNTFMGIWQRKVSNAL